MNLMLYVYVLGSLKLVFLLVGVFNVFECRLIVKNFDDIKFSDFFLDIFFFLFVSIWWCEFVNCVLCIYIRFVWF